MKRNANTAAKIVPVEIDNTAWTFTPASVALMGHEMPAPKYDIAKDGSVYIVVAVEGIGVRLHAGKASPRYHDAFEAAMAAKAAETTPVETKPAPVAQEAKPAPAKPKADKAKAAKPAETKPAPVAQEAKPAPAKPKAAKAKAAKPAETKPAPVNMPADNAWIGTTIPGKGWRIAFDEAAQRTRVIMDAEPTAKQRAAIDAAGFYWSNATKSWNKKLTRKAYRAAMALAETLNALA